MKEINRTNIKMTEKGIDGLNTEVDRLKVLYPDFFTVTAQAQSTAQSSTGGGAGNQGGNTGGENTNVTMKQALQAKYE